jgi:outer membrane receptor protein involved in Fe transport
MNSSKSRLLAGSLLSGAMVAAFPAVTHAQAAAGGNAVQELVVTGSRIPHPNLEQPTPVTTITADAIRNSGTTSLGDALAQLPALASTGTVRANSDSGANVGGLSFPDLRSLGTSRTLTLVNGHRHVGGDAGDTAVDLNTIPTALVERVDVITGGASAIYGSDAVSGVINIILKEDFEGYQFDVQGGSPLNGKYGQSYSASATGGWNFDDDRVNLTVTLFGDKQERVRATQVKGLADWAIVQNPDDTGPSDGVPDFLYKPYVQTEYFHRYGSLVNANTLEPLTGFDAAGNPIAFPPRTGTNNLFYGSFERPCAICYSSDSETTLVPRTSRYGADTTFRYQITPSVRLRGDLKYVETKTLDTFSSSFTTFEYVLDADNAFITPGLQALLDQHPNDIYFVDRTNQDIGGRDSHTTRKTFRAVFDLDGKVDAGFSDVNWDLSYNYGQTRNEFNDFNGLIPGNFNAAIDAVRDPATGQIRCRMDVPSTWYPGYAPPDRSTLTGEACVPFNLFGEQNTEAAKRYVTYESVRKHTITQQVASATANWDTSRFLNLPAGPLRFAGGFEWRREESRNINDPFVQSGITETAPQPNATGGFEVKEAFIEGEVPLLRDAPFAEELTINAAIRAADYSHAGNATAYMVRGTWTPVRDLTLRGTYSKATRAPNITEAFLPATPGFNQVFDPCEAASLSADPDRPKNCAALGVMFQDATDNQFPGVTSGNEDLRSEKAETWTVGFIARPHWVPGLSVTLDYYDIQINDAISFLDPQDAADKCVDGPELALEYCNLIIRDPVTKQIQSYRSTYLNQAKLETAGYDLQVAYTTDVSDFTSGMGPLSRLDGRITGSVTANYIEKLRQFAFQDFPDTVDRQEGEVGTPRWSFISSLSYTQGPVTLTWESQFLDKSRRNKDRSLERYDRPYVESVWYHDLIARYRFQSHGDWEAFVGMNNIFDKTIPVGLTGNGSSFTGDAAYDIYGRYMFAGLRARF